MTNNLLINNYIIYNIKFLCHLFVNNEFRVLSFCHLSLSVCLGMKFSYLCIIHEKR